MKRILYISIFLLASCVAIGQITHIRPAGGGGTNIYVSNDNMVANFTPTLATVPLRVNDVAFDTRRGNWYRWNGISWQTFAVDNGEQATIPYTVTNPAANIATGWNADLYNKITVNYTTSGVDTFRIEEPTTFSSITTPGEIFVVDFNTSSRTGDADTVLIHFDSLFRTYDGQLIGEWKCPPRGRIHMAFRVHISVEGAQWVEVDDILGSYGHTSGGGGGISAIKVPTTGAFAGLKVLGADSVGFDPAGQIPTIPGGGLEALDVFAMGDVSSGSAVYVPFSQVVGQVRDTIAIDTSFSNVNINTTTLNSLIKRRANVVIGLTTTSAAITDYGVYLPSISTVTNKRVSITLASTSANIYRYKIRTSGNDLIRLGNTGGRATQTYTLGRAERIVITIKGTQWVLNVEKESVPKSTTDELLNNRYIEGDIIEFSGRKYKIAFSIPSSYAIDSSVIIPVRQKIPYGENLCVGSQHVANGSSTNNGWTIGAGLRPGSGAYLDYAIAPDGTKTADALIIDADAGKTVVKRIDNNRVDSITWTLGEPVTLTGYFKFGSAASNRNITISSVNLTSSSGAGTVRATGTITLDATNTDWQYVQVNFVPTSTAPKTHNQTFGFTVNGDNADTLYVWGFQLERFASASTYKPNLGTAVTDWTRFDSTRVVYAMLQTEEGLLDLNGVLRRNADDSRTIQAALDYCEDLGLATCKGVVVADGMTIKSQIEIPEYLGLVGYGNPVINVDINDSTATAITFTTSGGTARYQYINGLEFDINSPLKYLCDTGGGLRNVFSNLTVNGTVDAVANLRTAIKVGRTSGGASAIGSLIKDTTVKGCKWAGIYYDAGAIHVMDNVVSSQSSVGFRTNNVGLLTVNSGDFESNDSVAFELNNAENVTIQNTYFEEGNYKINQSIGVTFGHGNRISLGSGAINGYSTYIVQNSRMYGDAIIANDYSNLRIVDNHFSSDAAIRNIINRYRYNKKVTITGNYSDTKQQEKNYLPNLVSNGGEIENGVLREAIISDTTTLNQVFLKGINQNLVLHSDSLAANSTGTYFNIENNNILAPDGTMTADLLIGTANQGGTTTGLRTLSLSKTIQQGSTTTLSVYAKVISEADPTAAFVIRYGGIGGETGGGFYSKEWQRYEFVIDSADATSNTLTVRIKGVSVGDSIAFWRWQLNEGDFSLKPIKTTTTGINDTTTQFTFYQLDLNGTIKHDGALKDSSGSPGTAGQVPISTVTGWAWGATIDNSITNEGSLTVGAGGANSSTIVSNTSGSTPVTIAGGNRVNVTESGSTITLAVADTVYISLSPLRFADSLKTIQLLDQDYFNVPSELNGYTISKVEYSVFAAGSGTGSVTVAIRAYNSSRGISYSNGAAQSFSAGDIIKTSTSGGTLATGQLIVPQITADSIVTHPLGLSVLLMLTKA